MKKSNKKRSAKPGKDMVLKGKAQQPQRQAISSIFKGEASNKIRNLRASGLSALGNTRGFVPVGDENSSFMSPLSDGGLIPSLSGGDPTGIRGSMKLDAGLTIQASDTTQVKPFFHTPGNAQDAYNLPKTYIEQIRWSRLMYNLNAYLGAITDLKAYYAYSKFGLTTSEPFVTEFYTQNAFNKNFNLYDHILRMSLGFHKFGEAIPWGAKKQDGTWPKTGKPRWTWDYFILLEPELVEIKKSLVGSTKPQYFLRPSRDLEELVEKLDSNDPEYALYQNKIAGPIRDKIKKRELIPLDPHTISSIQNLTDASATRGTPPFQRLFVTYILEDFIRLAQMAQANRYHFPIELWTLGDLDKNILPSTTDLENLRDLVTDAIQQPPFAIFFPPILKYEALGVQGKLLPIKDDYEYIHKQYMIGMGVSDNLILGESGIFSSAETSSNQAFIRARKKERDQIEDWMTWQFFEPLARWNNLKVKKGSILAPILPDYEWEKTLDFTAEEKEREDAKWLFEKGIFPTKRLLSKLRENPDEIEKELEAEIGTVFDDGQRIAAPAIREGAQGASDERGGRNEAGGADSPIPEGGLGGPGGGGGGGGKPGGGAEAPPGEVAPQVGEGAGPAPGAPGGAGEGGKIAEKPEIL